MSLAPHRALFVFDVGVLSFAPLQLRRSIATKLFSYDLLEIMYDLIRATEYVLTNVYEVISCFKHDVELSFIPDDFRTKIVC